MLLHLDFASGCPLYLQIRNQIVLGIADGRLQPGERLPTIRALADEFGINMMTVNKAYGLLKQEGYIRTDRRSGAVVSGGTRGHGLSEQARQTLRLLISEARLNGLPKEEFLALCSQLYEDREG